MTFDEIVYEYDKKHSQQLEYVAISRVIFNKLFNIILSVDHGTYYKFYFFKFKNNNTADFSYTNCSLNTNM